MVPLLSPRLMPRWMILLLNSGTVGIEVPAGMVDGSIAEPEAPHRTFLGRRCYRYFTNPSHYRLMLRAMAWTSTRRRQRRETMNCSSSTTSSVSSEQL
ncbi:hypothetical protein BJ166DRAFT_531237 [Pestalotiopsis sp. NC0098]|nr:hypothetical protein BJ166DRAFT_531237 [Pestalotiopsis sp. NC0098]